MKKALVLTCAVIMLAFIFTSQALAGDVVKIGILAKRGPQKCMKEFSALAKYLTKEVGSKFEIVPLKFVDISPACQNKTIDFLYANSWFYIKAKQNYGAQAIATVSNKIGGTMFGGVIFSKKSSGINTIADVKGKKVLCPKLSSAGGWLFQKYEFIKNGIYPEKDFASLGEAKKHDNVVLAVKAETVDVGCIRTNILEFMSEEGKIDISDFNIINKMNDNFPQLHSTALYPSWPMASLSYTDNSIIEKTAKALISLTSNSDAAKAAKIVGFVEPEDYSSLENILKELRMDPFTNQ